jgi:hypothetical protein
MSANWASDAAAQLRKRAADTERREALLLEQRKLREEQGPGLWGLLQQAVADRCLELNKEYGQPILFFKSVKTDEFQVKFEFDGKVSTLTARFTVTTATDALKWNYAGHAASQRAHDGSYMLSPINGVVTLSQTGTQARELKDIAEEMLTELLKG